MIWKYHLSLGIDDRLSNFMDSSGSIQFTGSREKPIAYPEVCAEGTPVCLDILQRPTLPIRPAVLVR
jgi:hypothetical protein